MQFFIGIVGFFGGFFGNTEKVGGLFWVHQCRGLARKMFTSQLLLLAILTVSFLFALVVLFLQLLLMKIWSVKYHVIFGVSCLILNQTYNVTIIIYLFIGYWTVPLVHEVLSWWFVMWVSVEIWILGWEFEFEFHLFIELFVLVLGKFLN